MDASQYYITTLSNAAMKIGPMIAYLVVGYLIFFKLPFFFLLRNMRNQKQELRPNEKILKPVEDYDVKDYERFVKRMKHLDAPKSERKKEERKQEKKEEKKKEQKVGPRKSETLSLEAQLFDFKLGEVITKDELRKRYHELLRQNHPDKVAALSPDFKNLADKKTKEINSAYAKLKKTAA